MATVPSAVPSGIARLSGMACVEGTRIAVTSVLSALRSSQVIVKHVQKYYPTLTGRQIDAVLRHARDVVERSDDAWTRREKTKTTQVGRRRRSP